MPYIKRKSARRVTKPRPLRHLRAASRSAPYTPQILSTIPYKSWILTHSMLYIKRKLAYYVTKPRPLRQLRAASCSALYTPQILSTIHTPQILDLNVQYAIHWKKISTPRREAPTTTPHKSWIWTHSMLYIERKSARRVTVPWPQR